MLAPFCNQGPVAGVTVFGTRGGDSGHWLSHLVLYPILNLLQCLSFLTRDLKFVAVHFPLDAD